MADVDLAALADAGSFVSHEHQAHLADAVKIGRWRIDAATSALVFTDGGGAERRVRAHFVGTSSPADGTWLWGWENINGFPSAFVKQAEKVRALGERYGIAEFTSARLPLDDELPGVLVRAVTAVTGVTAHFSAPTGNGETLAWLLLDDPSLALPPPTVSRTVGVVTSALSGSGPVDHRRALTAWSSQRGVGESAPGPDIVELTLSDGTLQVRFDAANRVSGMGRRLRSVPKRTPSPAPQAPPAPPQVVAPEPPTPTLAEERAALAAEPQAPSRPARRRGLVERLLGRP